MAPGPTCLVIETATAACSVALIAGETVMAEAHEIVGRGHAERLIPMIASLPGGGRADAILVDCGPGSFTGIRVGIAAARGLALGWGVEARGFSSLALIAAATFAEDAAPGELSVAIEGGHGEVFIRNFTRPFLPQDEIASLVPAEALAAAGNRAIVGSATRWLQPLAPRRRFHDRLPRAAEARLLPTDQIMQAASPIYARVPDAQPMAPA